MRMLMHVSYDGTNYNGWQSQPDGNTIQDVIQTALSKVCNEPISIVGAGRTDAGVHAKDMVFHFDTVRDMAMWKWVRGVNSYLPSDIRIQSAQVIDDDFHSRYHSKMKTYRYVIDLVGNNPFTRLYAFSCYYTLDVEAMEKASHVFIGTHDFTSFNSSDPSMNPIRTVKEINFSLHDNLLYIDFIGPGFLRYMVRMMVGCLIEVGKGKLSSEEIQMIMAQKQKGACRYKASANGLTLLKIDYTE